MAMGLGVSDRPFVGADVGGFMENTTPELLARWYQYGALTPFCRNHNHRGQIDQYPWTFGDTVEAICRRAVEWRYRLMPYLYAAFVEAGETVVPVQRPLVFDYQDDPAARSVTTSFCSGETCWWLRYTGKARRLARSTCPKERGTTRTARPARARPGSQPPRRWTRSPCTRTAAASCRCGRKRRLPRWDTTRRASSCTCTCRPTTARPARRCTRTTARRSISVTARPTARNFCGGAPAASSRWTPPPPAGATRSSRAASSWWHSTGRRPSRPPSAAGRRPSATAGSRSKMPARTSPCAPRCKRTCPRTFSASHAGAAPRVRAPRPTPDRRWR